MVAPVLVRALGALLVDEHADRLAGQVERRQAGLTEFSAEVPEEPGAVDAARDVEATQRRRVVEAAPGAGDAEEILADLRIVAALEVHGGQRLAVEFEDLDVGEIQRLVTRDDDRAPLLRVAAEEHLHVADLDRALAEVVVREQHESGRVDDDAAAGRRELRAPVVDREVLQAHDARRERREMPLEVGRRRCVGRKGSRRLDGEREPEGRERGASQDRPKVRPNAGPGGGRNHLG